MRPRAAGLALAACLSGSAWAEATDWAFMNPLLAEALDIRPGEGGALLFPNHADPTVADVAIAFFYFESRSGGSSMGRNIGLLEPEGQVWSYVRAVSGLFGMNPRDPAFLPDRIEFTTTTLGPDDPRCCPSETTRWVVDRASGVAGRLP